MFISPRAAFSRNTETAKRLQEVNDREAGELISAHRTFFENPLKPEALWMLGTQCTKASVVGFHARLGILSEWLGDGVTPIAKHIYDSVEEVEPLAPLVAKAAKEETDEIIEADLERIEGIGPEIAATLRAAGVVSVTHLAVLDPEAVSVESHELNHLYSRMVNGEWIEQARSMGAGAEAENRDS